MPVTRPAGRALLVVHESSRSGPLDSLTRQGFQCAAREDPYAAMAELARRPLAYRAVVLSLQSLYPEELGFIASVKRRWPHLSVWLTHTDGRAATLAEAIRLGIDGLLTDDGQLHRTAAAGGGSGFETASPLPVMRAVGAEEDDDASRAPMTSVSPLAGSEPATADAEASAESPVDQTTGEPVLTAEELRALLQDPPPAAATFQPSAEG